MSAAALNKPLDARKLSFQCAEINGKIELSKLARFSEAVMDANSYADFVLQFHTEFNGHAGVRGQIRAVVGLQCQRCLNCVQHDIDTSFNVRTVLTDAQAEAMLKDSDIVQLSETGLLDALALIEDELLLSLPLVSYHDEADCGGSMQFGDEEPAIIEQRSKVADNPFAILATLNRPKEEE